MSIHAVGDLHLSLDSRIEKPMDVFGKEWENHHIRLAEYWKTTVTEEDTVIVAGDISWGLRLEEAKADLDFVASLPGKKVLIKGNHDLWWNSISKLNAMYDSMIFLQNSCVKAEGWYICGSRGWICPGNDEFSQDDEKLYKRECGRIKLSLEAAANRQAQNIIVAMHYPPTNDKLQPSAFTKMYQEAGVKKVVYGHLHGKSNFRRGLQGHFCGADYQLVSLDYLECQLKKLV